jgi:hypothetical protein
LVLRETQKGRREEVSFTSPISQLAPSNVLDAAYNAAATYGIDPALLLAVGEVESGLNAAIGNGTSGEIGPWQVLPSTAQGFGFSTADLQTLQGNANAAAAYLAYLLNKYGNVGSAIVAYNEGETNYDKYGVLGAQPNGANPAQYVENVMTNYQNYLAGVTPNSGVGLQAPGGGLATTGAGMTSAGSEPWWANILGILPGTTPESWNEVLSGNTAAQANTIQQGVSKGEFSWLSGIQAIVSGIETNVLLGGLALALIAGGFAIVAASSPKVQTVVKDAAASAVA